MRPPLLILAAVAFLSVPSLAEDLSDIRFKSIGKADSGVDTPNSVVQMPANDACAARQLQVGGTCKIDSTTQFCGGVESCEKYCCCAMSFDITKWSGVYDDKVRNFGAPEDIPGTLRPDSPDLVRLDRELTSPQVLTGYSGKIGTRAAAQGLQRLDAILARVRAAPPKPEMAGFTVEVKNCYRRAIGNEIVSALEPDAKNGNAEAVCGELFLMMHYEDMPNKTKKQNDLLAAIQTYKDKAFLMAWPGYTPHAAGVACDLVVKDAAGHDCFDATAGHDKSPVCAIDARDAVNLLNRAVAESGGSRLTYEAWHFEWGGPTGSRCTGADCDSIWPIP